MNNREFYAKYGNVTRIEKMPVPLMYEEFLEKNKRCHIGFFIDDLELRIIAEEIKLCGEYYTDYVILELPNTEENYYKALDKMVELWREEV